MSLIDYSIQYPDQFIHGIHTENNVVNDKRIKAEVFFNPKFNIESGYKEFSINWMDNPGAIDQLLNQKKDVDKRRFEYGYAVFNRKKMKEILFYDELFGINRAPLEKDDLNDENIYHGNIIYNKDISRDDIKLIAFCLVGVSFEEVISR